MNPSSLLNVSPDLMRLRGQTGMPVAAVSQASDRYWAIGASLMLMAALALLYLALC